jgi:hypothetical protein
MVLGKLINGVLAAVEIEEAILSRQNPNPLILPSM